ncbi:MAG: WbqC family protein [Candidatus Cryptobacteroides sp.]|nr:WbqC family protein [Candidatus Cryptobacteroides sp.]
MLLSSAYFPPLSWLALAARDFTLSPDRVLPSVVQLEACENYQKQSYRNRCYILAGDGMQMLQVPVQHSKGEVPLNIQNVLVDYSTPWVVRTERALDTAYETAAYYEYYRDDVFAVLDARPETLWELNLSTIRLLLEKTGIACMLSPTSAFAAPGSEPDDYRFSIHPKQPDPILESLGLERPYYQVFQDRLGGFTPRLSALDLLFNEGPDSLLWLKAL